MPDDHPMLRASRIVRRLRSHDDCLLRPIRGDVAEAADEIERLLAEVERLQDALNNIEYDIERGDRARVEWVRAARAARIRDAAEGRDSHPDKNDPLEK